MTAKVSVVVCVFNQKSYLEKCVRSILDQTVRELELFLIDDGSTDGSGMLCDALAEHDARIRVKHQPNRGPSAARNAGIALCSGEYVMFMDADDWADRGMVASMLRTADRWGADVVSEGSHVDWHDASGHLLRSEVRLPVAQGTELFGITSALVTHEFINLLGYVWNKLYRRSVLTNGGHGFDVSLDLYEDLAFNVRVLAEATVVFTAKAHVHYVQRPALSLGRRPRPRYVELRLASIAGLETLLETHVSDDRVVRDLLTSLRLSALRTGVVKAAGGLEGGMLSRRQALSQLRQGPLAAEVLRSIPTRHLGLQDRVLIFLLRKGLDLSTVMVIGLVSLVRRQASGFHVVGVEYGA